MNYRGRRASNSFFMIVRSITELQRKERPRRPMSLIYSRLPRRLLPDVPTSLSANCGACNVDFVGHTKVWGLKHEKNKREITFSRAFQHGETMIKRHCNYGQTVLLQRSVFVNFTDRGEAFGRRFHINPPGPSKVGYMAFRVERSLLKRGVRLLAWCTVI
jgi:hypothetical protein